MPASPAPSPAAGLTWQPPATSAGAWTLRLAGDWRGLVPAPAQAAPAALQGTLRFDASGLAQWDADLVPALWSLIAPLARRGVAIELDGLPEAVRAPIALALPKMPATPAREPLRRGPLALALGALREALVFVGEVVLACVHVLRGERSLRWGELLRQADRVGPGSVPIVTLTLALIGLMLAYMGGAQLGRLGAQTYIAGVVTVGIVRELAGMMTGVILAGRIGAAFAAELGTMQANEEIDALRTLGVDPVAHLVLPRVLATLAVAPLLIGYAMLVGVLAGLPAAVGVYHVGAAEYLHGCVEALTWTHLWIGLAKGTLYLALVALAGCHEGLVAGRNAQAVGQATTRAVVRSLLWIVIAASATTATLQALGY